MEQLRGEELADRLLGGDGPVELNAEPAPGWDHVQGRRGHAGWGLNRLSPARPLAMLLAALVLGAGCCAAVWRGNSGLALPTMEGFGSGATATEVSPAHESRRLRFYAYHPFNLFYRITAQTLFGLPGETAANIPLLFSRYELDLVLRTASPFPFSPIAAGPIRYSSNTSSAPGGGLQSAAGSGGVSYDLLSYERYQPQAAAMYGAALLTLPRLTLAAAWLWDQPVYDMVRDSKVDYKAARDSIVSWLSDTARWVQHAAPRATVATVPQQEPQQQPQHKGDSNNSNSSSIGVSLGLLLWPLTWLFPGLVAAHLAFAFAATAPLAAAWTLIAGLYRTYHELRVLLHALRMLRRGQPQAAVQCVACSHGVPALLGAHTLVALRVLGLMLPPELFAAVVSYTYDSWVPYAAGVIMRLALEPNRGRVIGDAVDGFLGNLAHRADPDADHHHHHWGGGGRGGVSATVSLRRRSHWPPPVAVPAALQEAAECAPRHLLCPITHHILTEPAVTVTGATYERAAIIGWLEKAGKDPLTGHEVSPDEVFPNLAMYAVLEEYVAAAAAREAREAREQQRQGLPHEHAE